MRPPFRFRRPARCSICRRSGVRLYPFPVTDEDDGRIYLTSRCYSCLDLESLYGPA